jgi:hypothetical protein
MKEQTSIRIDQHIKNLMNIARRKMAVKESQTKFIETAVYQRTQRILKDWAEQSASGRG